MALAKIVKRDIIQGIRNKKKGMLKAKNIVKIFALTLVLLLLVGIRYVYAQPQNTGASPYRDSQHSYRVAIGLTANTQRWTLYDGTTEYEISALPPGVATYTASLINGGYDIMQIFFDHTFFLANSNWKLRFYETDLTHNCISAREFPINVVENTFYFTLASDITDICNSQSNLVHTYEEVDGPADVYNTEVTYSVFMNKNDNFDPTSWVFDANFSQAVTSFSAVTNDGTLTSTVITAGTDYRINVVPTVANPSSVTVNIVVSYSNPVLANVIRNLTVSNGKAIVAAPPAPDAVTDDNITVYPVSSPGDRLQAITILAIPATRNIIAGAGESGTSASKPLQYSRHNYTVQMGDAAANYASSSWHIEDNADVVVNPANYILVASQNVNNANATFTFNMVPGIYKLVFTEVGTNTCSTIRKYTITLGEPFDVDIDPVSSDCAAASNVIYDDLTETTTTIVYTVKLNTVNYGSNWSFDFALNSVVAFGSPNLAVSSLTVAGGTYSGTNYLGSVSVSDPVDEVAISVVYTGLYITSHDITATLSNIKGSFNEVDADILTGTGNSAGHTIYSMPQITVLAGVD